MLESYFCSRKLNQNKEQVVDVVVSHPPRDPTAVNEDSWQGHQYVIQHHQQQPRQHYDPKLGRFVFQVQENCQNSQFAGPSLPTTLGSVAAGFGCNSIPSHKSKPSTSSRNYMVIEKKFLVFKQF